jgi:hypothetical protein
MLISEADAGCWNVGDRAETTHFFPVDYPYIYDMQERGGPPEQGFPAKS